MGTRARVWFTMALLVYPFWATGMSTCSLAAGEGSALPRLLMAFNKSFHSTGILVASFYSGSNLIRYGVYAMLVSPLSCGVVFLWIITLKTSPKETDFVDVEKLE